MKNKKTILVIDDEIEIRNDLKESLELSNFDVIIAANGFEGFEKLIKFTPDLVICDVMMPVMNGYELLELIRKNDSISNTPFLFLTAKVDYEDLREGMNLGADDYLTKPYDYNNLIKAINTRLEKSNIEKSMYENKIESMKNSIFRSIPHEIRTPLNGILNNSDWIIKNLNKISIEKLRDNIIDINKDAIRLNRLFENYIFIVKLKLLTQDLIELESIRNAQTNYPNVIVRDISSFIFNNKNIKCVVSVSNDISKVNIYEHYFSKVIYELLDNALKFSYPKSTVKIKCKADDEKYSISISNEGTKFPEAKINEITEFKQFNRESLEQGGVGIGLSVVKQILEIYGSELIIKTKNENTEISFTISI